MKIALLCGGPSRERGISLNSARSVLDHLESPEIEIVPIYFDVHRRAYHISTSQLYSNTPSDFDFKLKTTAKALSQKELVQLLKQVDIAFPAMHGPFGEDGGVQAFLEKHKIPFIGSGSKACQKAFDKHTSNQWVARSGFHTLPSLLIERAESLNTLRAKVPAFFNTHQIERAIVKPASGGSSIGVFSVSTPDEALERIQHLFLQKMDTRLVIEPFATGTEFTVIILENRFGLPVALPPTEIETDYSQHQILDFRRKYLPTRQVIWHCPPRFPDSVIEKIQAQAEQLFASFGLHDCGRFDGWVLPDGRIWFCDFNIISGMEQNSFLFQQSSRIGMTHSDVLKHIVEVSCLRQGLKTMDLKAPETSHSALLSKKPVSVLLGGYTSERQVSLMSGTNVWLKLRTSQRYTPTPYLLDLDGQVWKLPYHLALNHTVEEVMENCKHYPQAKARLNSFESRARLRLGLTTPKDPEIFFEPTQMPLSAFIQQAPFVFIGLHGGMGEDGTLQGLLSEAGVLYNGSNRQVSHICMDKWETARQIQALNLPHVETIPNATLSTTEFLQKTPRELDTLFHTLSKNFKTHALIIKPRSDGCSTGVIPLHSAQHLKTYAELLKLNAKSIPKNTFPHQTEVIEMPLKRPDFLLFERFIETDILRVKHLKIHHQIKSGWVEMTMGVLGQHGQHRAIHALNPSITIAEGKVLSVEEKFQGGTGINITPPPDSIVPQAALARIKTSIQMLAERMGLEGYARIDFFAETQTGNIQIIEINTLPGLTPSTVLYHQGLAEHPPLFPVQLLEQLIQNKGY